MSIFSFLVIVIARLQAALQSFLPPGKTTNSQACVVHSHTVYGWICVTNRVLLKWLWLLRLGYKRYYRFHFALSQRPAWENPAAMLWTHIQPYEEVHMAKNWDLMSIGSINLPVKWFIRKPSHNWSTRWNLDCNLMKEIKSKPPR